MKLYVVCWSCSYVDDHDNVGTNTGVQGLYKSKESAKVGLEEFKDEVLANLREDVDPDGDMPELMDEIDLAIWGSVDEEYYEISYTLGIEPVVEQVKIKEVELED